MGEEGFLPSILHCFPGLKQHQGELFALAAHASIQHMLPEAAPGGANSASPGHFSSGKWHSVGGKGASASSSTCSPDLNQAPAALLYRVPPGNGQLQYGCQSLLGTGVKTSCLDWPYVPDRFLGSLVAAEQKKAASSSFKA